MRAFIPAMADDPDVHEHYAADWLDRGGLRVNMIASLDGAATSSGRSQGLQTAGDNRVFAALRDLADVVVVGAGTAVKEKYAPIELGADRTAVRQRYGLAAALPTALVSRSLHVDPSNPLFVEAKPEARTIVYTCAAADATRRSALDEVADVVVCGEGSVDLSLVRQNLTERGLHRVLSEGGPTLFSTLAGDGVLDEVCVSISPLMTGPGSIRIVDGPTWQTQHGGFDLVGLLEEDGALFARYRTQSTLAS